MTTDPNALRRRPNGRPLKPDGHTKEYKRAYNREYRLRQKAAGVKPDGSAQKRAYRRNPEPRKAWMRAYRRANLDWIAFLQQLSRHRITLDQYCALEESQDFLCAICGTLPKRRLTIDHDHKTGKIRGLLCGICNDGLGKFLDHPSRILGALAYIRKYHIGDPSEIAEAPGLQLTSARHTEPSPGRQQRESPS